MSAGGTGLRLGFAADVWSLAATAVYIFTKSAPYSGQTVWQIITALTAERLPPIIPESVPAALRGLLLRCFAFEPEARPQVHEIVQQLQVRRRSLLLGNISHVYPTACLFGNATFLADLGCSIIRQRLLLVAEVLYCISQLCGAYGDDLDRQ